MCKSESSLESDDQTLESAVLNLVNFEISFLLQHTDYKSLDPFAKSVVVRDVYLNAVNEYLGAIEEALTQDSALELGHLRSVLSSSIADDRRRLLNSYGVWKQ
jgi:predicted Co/Zn/Cd cation transporter (cation efflux family)